MPDKYNEKGARPTYDEFKEGFADYLEQQKRQKEENEQGAEAEQGRGFGVNSSSYGRFADRQAAGSYAGQMAEDVKHQQEQWNQQGRDKSWGESQRQQYAQQRAAAQNREGLAEAYGRAEARRFNDKGVELLSSTVSSVVEELKQEQQTARANNRMMPYANQFGQSTTPALPTPAMALDPKKVIDKVMNRFDAEKMNELVRERFGNDFDALSDDEQQQATNMIRELAWQALGKEYQTKDAMSYIAGSMLTNNLMARMASAVSSRSALDKMARERYGRTFSEIAEEDEQKREEVAQRMYGKPLDDLTKEQQQIVSQRAAQQYDLKSEQLRQEQQSRTTWGMYQQGLAEYEQGLKGWKGTVTKGAAGAATMVVDGVPFMVFGGIGGFAASRATGAMASAALRGVSNPLSRAVIANGITTAARTQAVNAMLQSGLTFGLYDAASAGVESYASGNFSFGDIVTAGTKGFGKGAALGIMNSAIRWFGNRYTAPMKGKAGVAARVGTSALGYGGEVAAFTALDHLEQNGFTTDNFDWASAGEQAVLIGLLKLKGHEGSSDGRTIIERWKNPIAEQTNSKLTQEDIDTLVGLGYGKKSGSIAGWVKSMYDLKVDAETGEATRGDLKGAMMDGSVPVSIRRKLLYGYGVVTPEATVWSVSEPTESETYSGQKQWTVTTYTENSKPVSIRTFSSKRVADSWARAENAAHLPNQIAELEQMAGARSKHTMTALYQISSETGRPMRQLIDSFNMVMNGKGTEEDLSIIRDAVGRADRMAEAERQRIIAEAKKEAGWMSSLDASLQKDPAKWNSIERERIEEYRETLAYMNAEASADPRTKFIERVSTKDGKIIKANDKYGNTYYVSRGAVVRPNGGLDAEATKRSTFGGGVLVYDENGSNPRIIKADDLTGWRIEGDAASMQKALLTTYNEELGAQPGNMLRLRTPEGEQKEYRVLYAGEGGEIRVEAMDGSGEYETDAEAIRAGRIDTRSRFASARMQQQRPYDGASAEREASRGQERSRDEAFEDYEDGQYLTKSGTPIQYYDEEDNLHEGVYVRPSKVRRGYHHVRDRYGRMLDYAVDPNDIVLNNGREEAARPAESSRDAVGLSSTRADERPAETISRASAREAAATPDERGREIIRQEMEREEQQRESQRQQSAGRYRTMTPEDTKALVSRMGDVLGNGNVISLRQGDFTRALDKVAGHGTAEIFHDSRGTVYGFAVGGKVYLNESRMNAHTPIHEHSHIWTKAVKEKNPELYQQGLSLWKMSAMWEEVKEDLAARKEAATDEAVLSEIVARFSGKANEKAVAELEASASGTFIEKCRQWLGQWWKAIKNYVGKSAFSAWSKEELNRLTKEEFASMPLKALYDDAEASAFRKAKEGMTFDNRVEYHAEGEKRERSAEELLGMEARRYDDELRNMTEDDNVKTMANKMRRFVISRVPAIGNRLTGSEIYYITRLLEKAKTIDDLYNAQRQIKRIIHDAEAEAELEAIDKLMKTRTTVKTAGGLRKGVLVDETTGQIFNAIRGSYKGLMLNTVDRKITLLNRERRALRAELDGRSIEDADEDVKQRYYELENRYKALQKERAEAELHDERDTLPELMKRKADIEKKIIDTAEHNEELQDFMLQEYIALPIKTELAEIRERTASISELKKKMEGTRDKEEIGRYISAIDDLEIEIIEKSRRVRDHLEDLISEGVSKRAEAVMKKIEHQQWLVKTGFEAVDYKPVREPNEGRRDTGNEKWDDFLTIMDEKKEGAKQLINDLESTCYSIDYLLKSLDRNHHQGEGELFKYFMQSEHGVQAANDNYFMGLEQFHDAVNAKANELFGKDIEKVAKESNRRAPHKISRTLVKDTNIGKAGDVVEVDLTKGEALYLWLMWRQEKGAMKMEASGFARDTFRELDDMLEPSYKKFGEWVTDEFLPQLRDERYNPTYKRVYGTDMGRAAHYFPIEVWKRDLHQKGDLGQGVDTDLPIVTSTNLLARTDNDARIDSETNAFEALMRYGDKMENFNAFVEVSQDLNTLYKSRRFREAIKANEGEAMWEHWVGACDVATNSYKGSTDITTKALNNLLGKWQNTFAKLHIDYRWWTAIKQFASYQAFFTHSFSPSYQAEFFKNILTMLSPKTSEGAMQNNYKWAMEHLPSFRQRVHTGNMGIEGYDEKGLFGGAFDAFRDKGMWLNKKIDAATVAAGARAVYNHSYRSAIKDGRTPEEANRLAVFEAETCFNESQQSSRPEYSSPIQKDRTLQARMFVLYQNSSIGYNRSKIEGWHDIIRARYVRDKSVERGADKAEADKRMKKAIYRGTKKLLNFGIGLPVGWYFFSNPSIFFEKDDEDKKEDDVTTNVLINAGLGLLTNGTVAGPMVNSMLYMIYNMAKNGKKVSMYQHNSSTSVQALDLINDVVMDIAGSAIEDGQSGFWHALGRNAMKTTIGDPETFVNIGLGIQGWIADGTLNTEDVAFLLNVPKSQRTKIVERTSRSKPLIEYVKTVLEAEKAYDKDDWRYRYLPTTKEKKADRAKAITSAWIEMYLNDPKDKDVRELIDGLVNLDADLAKKASEKIADVYVSRITSGWDSYTNSFPEVSERIETRYKELINDPDNKKEYGKTHKDDEIKPNSNFAKELKQRAMSEVLASYDGETFNAYKRAYNTKAGSYVPRGGIYNPKYDDETYIERMDRLKAELKEAAKKYISGDIQSQTLEAYEDDLNNFMKQLMKYAAPYQKR